jgi:hypothetical protein
MAVVELTTTVVPPDPRGTAVFATAIGILAVIHRLAHEQSRGPALSAELRGSAGIQG